MTTIAVWGWIAPPQKKDSLSMGACAKTNA